MTGFHGLHVTIGCLALLFCYIRHFVSHLNPEAASIVRKYVVSAPVEDLQFRAKHHVGFEAAA